MVKIIATETDAHGRRNLWRGYTRASDRKRARTQLLKRGLNYFVFYRDVNAEFAMEATFVDWACNCIGGSYTNY